MTDEGKPAAQLLEEVAALRQRVAALQAEIAAYKYVKETRHDSDSHYRIISEMVSDYAYAVRIAPDWTYTVEWSTPTFTRVTGYPLERGPHAPDTWRMLIYPADLSIAYQRGQKLMAGQEDAREFRILTKSGEARWVHEYGRPVWDEAQRRVTQLYIAGRDITERKQGEGTPQWAKEKGHTSEPYIDPSLVSAWLEEPVPPNKALEATQIATLTAQERQVIALIGAGLCNREIAQHLFIREATVCHQLTSILRKLEVADRLELVVYAFQHGLVKLPS